MVEFCVSDVPFGARANNHRLRRLSAKGPLAFPVFVLAWFWRETEKDALRDKEGLDEEEDIYPSNSPRCVQGLVNHSSRAQKCCKTHILGSLHEYLIYWLFGKSFTCDNLKENPTLKRQVLNRYISLCERCFFSTCSPSQVSRVRACPSLRYFNYEDWDFFIISMLLWICQMSSASEKWGSC